MFSIIFILFLFFLFLVPTVILSIITRVLSIFKPGTKRKKTHDDRGHHDTYTHVKTSDKRKGKKIFDKDEGEYVDFEEIK